MHRRIVIAFAAAALAIVPPALTRAHSGDHGPAHADADHGFAYGDDDNFGWAVVSGDQTSMSGVLDHGTLESLKDRFGDDFLVIDDGGHRFVITDDKLFERAQETARDLQKYGREFGEIARAQVRLSLGGASPDRRIERLERRLAAVEREMRDEERHGGSTDDLEIDVMQLRAQLDALKGLQKSFSLTADERGDLTRRKEEAQDRLRRCVRQIHDDMKDILKEAKARHLAEPVE